MDNLKLVMLNFLDHPNLIGRGLVKGFETKLRLGLIGSVSKCHFVVLTVAAPVGDIEVRSVFKTMVLIAHPSKDINE